MPAPFAQEQMAHPVYNRRPFFPTGPEFTPAVPQVGTGFTPEQMNSAFYKPPQDNPMAAYAQNPVMAAPPTPQQDMSVPDFVQQQMADPTFEREPTTPDTPMSDKDKAALAGGLGQVGKILSAAGKEEEAPQMKAPGMMNPNAGFLNFLSGRQEQFQPRVTRVPTPSLLY